MLVAGDVLGDVGLDLARCQGGAGLANNKSLREFASLLIGHTNHGDVGNLWMRNQQRFQLGGRDLEALVLDQFLESIHDRDVVVFVDHGDVSRVEPTVRIDRAAGCLVVVEVALHHLRAPDPQFARFADTTILAGVRINDSDLGVRDGHPRRSRPEVARWRGVTDRAQLGHPVALRDFTADPCRGLSREFRSKRCRTGEDLLERRQVELIDERVLRKSQDNWRYHGEAGDPMLLDQRQRLLKIEARLRHGRDSMGEQTIHEDLHPVDMEEREER